MQILNKTQMYKLLRSGAFGNTARTWSSYEELEASDYRGLLGIRSLIPGGPFLSHVPFEDAPRAAGLYSEMQENENILLQGEVYRSTAGLYLYASKVKQPMRVALKGGGKHYWRLHACGMLQESLWPSDFVALSELMELYTDSVVEFSAYSKAVGLIPKRNTIIWEVRNY